MVYTPAAHIYPALELGSLRLTLPPPACVPRALGPCSTIVVLCAHPMPYASCLPAADALCMRILCVPHVCAQFAVFCKRTCMCMCAAGLLAFSLCDYDPVS